MDRLIWKDMYIVWDKMKDETDELRESLKRFCELPLSGVELSSKLTIRYRLDTVVRTGITQDPELCHLANPESEPRMQLRSMQRGPNSLTNLSEGYGPEYGQLLENSCGFSR